MNLLIFDFKTIVSVAKSSMMVLPHDEQFVFRRIIENPKIVLNKISTFIQ